MSDTLTATSLSARPTFNEIPADWHSPGTFLEVRPNYSNKGIAPIPTRVLLIAQARPGTPGLTLTPVQVTRRGQAAAMWGAGSVASEMADGFILANPFTELWVLAIPDAAGATAAVGHVVYAGAPSVNGTVMLHVGGRRISVTALAASPAASIAADMADAVNAIDDLPVVASAAGANLSITARHGGALGNLIDLRTGLRVEDVLPPGMTAAYAAMAGGAGEIDITPALAAVATQWFTDFGLAWADAANLGRMADDLARRYRAMGKLDGHAYVARRGTYDGLAAGAADYANSPFISPIGADRSPTSPWIWTAALAGVCAFHLTNDPARQLRSLVLPGVIPPTDDYCFTDEEQDQLLRHCISTWEKVVGQVVLARVVTGYTQTTLGAADTAWLDIMVPKTMTRIRYDWLNYMSLTYPRCKLAPNGSLAEQYDADGSVATPRRVHNSWGGRCKLYAARGWIINERETIADSVFVIDPDDRNRLNTIQRVDQIGNLMVLAGALEFAA